MAEKITSAPDSRNIEPSNPVQVINLAELRRHLKSYPADKLGSLATFASNTEITTPINLLGQHELERSRYPVASLSEASPRHPKYNDDRAFASPRGCIGVFDGVGGQQGSEAAADTAANIMSRQSETVDLTTNPVDVAASLADGLRSAGEAVAALEGSVATTATIAAITRHNGNRYVSWAAVGDSRLMIFRPANNTLHSLTLDETSMSIHKPYNTRTLEQQELDAVRTYNDYENLAPHRKVSYTKRNEIAYALGVQLPKEIQTGYREVTKGDIVLAVSDAYTDNFTQNELKQILHRAIESNGGKVNTQQITETMNRHVQWFMRHYHETDSIRGKEDDASVAMMEVV